MSPIGEVTCDGCNRIILQPDSPDYLIEGPCRYGLCVELRCTACGHYFGGWGPVGCRCQDERRQQW